MSKKLAKCPCCGKDFRPNGMMGGRKPCGCESATCFKCDKCRDHCTCEWGRDARIQSIADAATKLKHTVIPPLRKRVEKFLKRSDPRLTTEYRELLMSALGEADTNFTMYQAWVKRATEAEAAYIQLKADLATAKQGLEHYASTKRWTAQSGVVKDGWVNDKYWGDSGGNHGYDLAQQTLDKIGKE